MKIIYSILIIALYINPSYSQMITAVCEGEDVYLHITSPASATSIQWQFSALGSVFQDIPGEISDTLSLPDIMTGGYYRARLENLACAAFYSDTQIVQINPKPTILINGNNLICAGTTVNLAASGAISYLWSSGASTSVVAVSPNTTTLYTVTGTDANGCQNTSSMNVSVSQPPLPATAGPDQNVSGVTTTLSAVPPVVGLGGWTIISGTGGTLGNPGSAQSSFTGLPNTSYTLVWSVSNAPCPVSSDTITVSFSGVSLPSIQCNGQTLYIHPIDNHGSIQWGCIGIVAGAGDDYDGANNTSLIVQSCLPPTAAYVCDTLTAYGFSDWYLPSYNELDCMRNNAAIIGGFSNGGYWSSTEGTGIFTSNARYRTFPSGVSGYGSKSSLKMVRCIRK